MRPVVEVAFPAWSAKFEDRVGYPYLDVKGLMTVGVGNRLFSLGEALQLPWERLDGGPASAREVADAYDAVSRRTDLARAGGGAFRNLTRIRLGEAAIDRLVRQKLREDDQILTARFDTYEDWCADAQLGALSLAWANGPHFRFPLWEVAARAGDWATCADECHLDERGNAGVHPRNIADRLLFLNAAQVAAHELDPGVLYYPEDLSAGCPPAA